MFIYSLGKQVPEEYEEGINKEDKDELWEGLMLEEMLLYSLP